MKHINALNNRLFNFSLTGNENKPDDALKTYPHVVGRMMRELFWTVGETRAHGIFSRMGISVGQFETRHSVEQKTSDFFGTLRETSRDEATREFTLEADNSIEATEHLHFFHGPSKQSQCWFLAGYLSGSFTVSTGMTIYVLETQCRAKGDALCRFVGRPAELWDEEHELMIDLFNEDNMAHELTQVRELLKTTKDRYQNLFEHASIPILILDPDTGGLLDANIASEELTGFSRTELATMNIFDLGSPDDHNRMMAALKEVSAEERQVDEEIKILRKDGQFRIVAASSKILGFGGQRVIQHMLRDITDLKIGEQKEKDLQHQLKRSERLSSIGQLAASVAHEIKNPLGAIRNAIYYIKNALTNNSVLETDPSLKDIIKLAEEEVDGAVTIIEELLDFSHVIQLVPRKISINSLIEMLPKIITIPENIQLSMDLDITLPSANADPTRLRQVFSNIAVNAIQSMPQGGKLLIKSSLHIMSGSQGEEGKELVAVSFEDTGVGIDPSHLKKIFEPLFTTKTHGTGLGLAICNNIVEKHGGSIEVASQIGKGSVFTVNIPLEGPENEEDSDHDIH